MAKAAPLDKPEVNKGRFFDFYNFYARIKLELDYEKIGG